MKKILFAVLLSVGVAAPVFAASGIDPTYPIATSNRNVWYLFQQYQVMLEEIDKSVTKDNMGTLPQDAARWVSYIDQMRNYTAYWQSVMYIDQPVTHGKAWELGDPLSPECTFKDNLSACDLMAMVGSSRDELALSGSGDLPMHLSPGDLTRQQQYWDTMAGFINDFMMSPGGHGTDEPITNAEERLGLNPGFDTEAQ